MICAANPTCCSDSWVVEPCINAVDALCHETQCGTAACGHTLCLPGNSVDASCNPCAAAVCAHDTYCCTDLWDATHCVREVDQYCTTLACP
jgi:hypothetical protein